VRTGDALQDHAYFLHYNKEIIIKRADSNQIRLLTINGGGHDGVDCGYALAVILPQLSH
jgi:hypothetical protein